MVDPCRAGFHDLVVVGTISDYTGNSDRVYVSVAQQALAAADQVIFVGSRASKSLKARRHPQDSALQAFPSVEAASAQLREFFRRGDLVLLKGVRHDHLESLISSRGTSEAESGTPRAEPSNQAVAGWAIRAPSTTTHRINLVRECSILLPGPFGQSGSEKTR